MKRLLYWLAATVVLMIVIPGITVAFAGSAGMAICFLLFYGANPFFSAACGFFAGTKVRKYWFLPLVNAVLFLAGVWIFFDPGEPEFLRYGGYYLLIGLAAMAATAYSKKKKKDKS